MTTPNILQQTFRNGNGIRKQSLPINMMMIFNWLLMSLLLLLQINTSDAAKFKGDSCTSKSQPGICKAWSECPVIKILIDRGEYTNREVVSCGFVVKEELICCPQVTAETKIENNADDDDRFVVLTTTTTTTPAPVTERDFWMDLLEDLNQTTAAPDFWHDILATTTTTTMRPLMVGNQRLNESSEFFDLNALLSGTQASQTNTGQNSDFSGTNNPRQVNNQNMGFVKPGNNNRGVNLNSGPVNFNQSPNNQRGNIGRGQQNSFRGNNGNQGQRGNNRGQLNNLREVTTNENGSNRNFLAQNNDDQHLDGLIKDVFDTNLAQNNDFNRPNVMAQNPTNTKDQQHLDSLIKDVFDTNSGNFEKPIEQKQNLDALITNIFDLPQIQNTQNMPNSQPERFQQQRQFIPPSQPQLQPVVAQTWPQDPVHRPEFDPIQTVNQNLVNSGMDIIKAEADHVQNIWLQQQQPQFGQQQQFRQQPQTNFRGNNGRGNNRGQQNGSNRNFFAQNSQNQNRHFKFPGNTNNPNSFNQFNTLPNNNNLQNPLTQNSPSSWSHNPNNRQPQGFQQQNVPFNQFETEPSTNFIRQPVVVQTWPQDPLHRPEFDPIQTVNQNLINSGMDIVKADADHVQNMWFQQQQPQFGQFVQQQNPNQFIQQQPQTNQLLPSQFGQQQPLQSDGPKEIRSVPQPSFGNSPNIQSPPINILDPFKPFEFRPSPEDEVNNSLSPNQKSTVKPSTERPAVRACRRIEKGLNASLTIHILGGTPVGLGEMPHMVGIGYSRVGGEDRPPYDIRCGGTLIDTRYVLTAAHCVSDRLSVPTIVRLGVVNNTEGANMNDALEIRIKETFIHDDYSTSSTYNDIAILELERPIVPNDIVYPVCLHSDMTDPDTSKKLWVSGWGTYNVTTRSFSNILLKAPLYTAPLESCNQSYVDYGLDRRIKEGVRRTQICAVYEGEVKDTCQGDSGGPLQLLVDESLKQYRLIGVVSAGFSCGIPIPSLYTRVAAFLDFIERIVWPNGGD